MKNKAQKQILQDEAVRFAGILQEYIDISYDHYSPAACNCGRNGSYLRRPLSVDDFCELSSNGQIITCRVLNICPSYSCENTHFIEKAINEFNKENRYNIKIEVIRPVLYSKL